MADPIIVITEAFEKLRRSISAEDAHDFASTSLKDVWKAVREIDATQRKRQSAQNLGRVEPLLRGLEKYSKVIEVLCNGTPFMPYVWAPIKLMLQLASQHRNVFEALLAAYAEIATALPRFDRYEKAFKENKEFQNVLASVYCDILHFHQRAYKFFRRRAWHLVFVSLWRDFEARFAGIIDGLKKQREFVDREAASIDIVEAKDSRFRMQEDIQLRQRQSFVVIEQNETAAKIARLQHAVAWLSVDDTDQEIIYERISSRRHDQTCEWFMRQPSSELWMTKDSNNHLLWLTGKPGAGKSVMCSYIIQQLLATPDLDTLYYFCSSHDIRDTSLQILRTLALQLLRRHPDMASMISHEFVYQGTSCGKAQLRVLIPQLLEISPSARIVIDGIDECSTEIQKLLLKDLQSLCLGGNSRCKILLSSRKEVHLAEKLSKKPQISLDGRDEVTSDIRLYVKYQITKLKTSNEDLLKTIESILVHKANGMFLWVRLVVDELRTCFSDWDLETKANSLPKGLNEAYDRILNRIMNDSGSDVAIRILEWLACSCRTLKAYEILDGITFVSPDSMVLDKKKKYHRDVLNLCRPLIENGPSDTVDFVHFSAKRYILEGEHLKGAPFVSSETAQFNISFSCMAYLNTSLCLLPCHSTPEERANIVVSGFHGLQPYANKFWIYHLLEYSKLLAKSWKPPRSELLFQLNLLLEMEKSAEVAEEPTDAISIEELTMLNQNPRIQSFISRVIKFREEAKAIGISNQSEKSVEDLSLESCSSDPFYFSAIRHYYQSTLESLLDPQAPISFPAISLNTLKVFAEIYGHSAFNCRYQHCSRATEGFQTSKQRDSHEATHRRKLRCQYPSCVDFSTGFTTPSALKRHNKKYHTTIDDEISLSTAISVVESNNSQPITDGYLLYIGVLSESSFICEATDCRHSFDDIPSLEDHFEAVHFQFTRINPAHQYRCSACDRQEPNEFQICVGCNRLGTCQIRVYVRVHPLHTSLFNYTP